MEEKNNKKVILAIIGVIVLIAGVVGLTVAYFMAQAESENITVTSKSLTLKYGPDPDSEIIATDIGPITEEEITTEAVTKTFSIAKQNDTDKDVYARIDIADIEISDNFKDYDLKWALYQGEEKVTTGSFVQTLDGSDTINMANNVLINSTTPIEYTLYIWIQETEQDQSELMSGTLTAKIKIVGESEKKNTLVSNILGDNNANVVGSTPTFGETSTDSGLFVQSGDSEKSNFGFATYYYRGEVTDNYVQLGTYKSDITNAIMDYEDTGEFIDTLMASENDAMLFRILRINEDGSIKLISEYSTYDTIAYNSTRSSRYINEDETDSEIKTEIDNWYNTHITESNIDNIIQYGDYCNDISEGLNAPSARISKNNPTFICQYTALMINEKVGTISVDELLYSQLDYSNVYTTYLYNGTSFWTSSLSSGGGFNFIMDAEMETIDFSPTKSVAATARPVITIKADSVISGGSGSKTDPYVIKFD